jgi:hypothetical protein
MKNRIPEYALVRDIQIHPTTNDLVLGTHGRGVIIVDNISPMRELSASVLEKDVHIFPAAPISINMGKWGDGGFPNTGGWNGGNPPSIQPIQYYLKDRVMSGDVKVEILDAEGKVVQSMPGSKRKGVNNIAWNLRMAPPKVASGGTKLDFAGFVAPTVMPGTYTVKLTVGDKEYKQPIKLVHDEANKDFTLEDRTLQNKTAMDIYRLHEDLSKLVETVNATQTMLKQNLQKTKDSSTKKLLTVYNDSLESFRATLLATKQKSIFADEVQLRERITEVYSAVVNQEARPSNLQIQRVSTLKKEFKKAEGEHLQVIKKYNDAVMKALQKEGLTEQKVF